VILPEEWRGEGHQDPSKVSTQISAHRSKVAGPQSLPPMQIMNDIQYFYHIDIYDPLESFENRDEARARLSEDAQDPSANLYIGFYYFQIAEDDYNDPCVTNPVPYLEAAIISCKELLPEPFRGGRHSRGQKLITQERRLHNRPNLVSPRQSISALWRLLEGL
jgi:hypothetical protein